MTSLEDIDLEAVVALGRRAADGGRPAQYIPELSRADPHCVAVAVQGVDGAARWAGDVDSLFTLQSVSKIFALAHLLNTGDPGLFDCVSMEPSGDAFHSIVRLEEEAGRPRNPLINAGALVVCDRLPGSGAEQRIEALRRYLRGACGEALPLVLDEAVFYSEQNTGFRNRALANYMRHFGTVAEPETALDTYFRQCSLTVSARELARLGLFLAAGGRDPVSGRRSLSAQHAATVLALMSTCGLYDEVGRFAVRVGVPAKSGVSGAILAVVPGRFSIACLGPALGAKGNSLAGMAMLEHLSQELELSMYFSP